MPEILTIFITILGAMSVKGGEETVNMVPFTGTAQSEYFTGEVLPGGVDTQRYTPEGGSLSARYMLRGIDCAGDSCTIFIENNGVFGAEFTTPRIVTDSKVLSRLNGASLKGKLDFSPSGLVIRIYESPSE